MKRNFGAVEYGDTDESQIVRHPYPTRYSERKAGLDNDGRKQEGDATVMEYKVREQAKGSKKKGKRRPNEGACGKSDIIARQEDTRTQGVGEGRGG